MTGGSLDINNESKDIPNTETNTDNISKDGFIKPRSILDIVLTATPDASDSISCVMWRSFLHFFSFIPSLFNLPSGIINHLNLILSVKNDDLKHPFSPANKIDQSSFSHV